MAEWHIITCEYPPQVGGVSDYTRQVADELAASGDTVHIWCPPSAEPMRSTPNVIIHPEFGRFAVSDIRRVGQMLNEFAEPRCLLVQWVPHGYGYQSMNLAFCLWLRARAIAEGDCVGVMFHEPFLEFDGRALKQSAAALIHRLMTIVLLSAARQVWVSIPAWKRYLRPYALGKQLSFDWLPVSSNIQVVNDPTGILALRKRLASKGELVLGHFGTYGRHITEQLLAVLPEILNCHKELVLILMGRGGERLRGELVRKDAAMNRRIHATGSLSSEELSRHLSTCDLLLQPYPDGISSRRTSAMAGLAHGLPIITTTGKQTESLWSESKAVRLVQVGEDADMISSTLQLITSSVEREKLSFAAKNLYHSKFHITRTVETLRKTMAVAL